MPADIYYDDVTLLLHFNGVDGSTVFTDNSEPAKTITASGTAQIDTAISVLGGASGIFVHASPTDFLTFPNGTMNFGLDDFTIEFRCRVTDATGYPHLLSMGGDQNSNNGFYSYINKYGSWGSDGLLNIRGLISNSPILTSTTDISAAWHSIAFCRQGVTSYLFIDGIMEDTHVAAGVANYQELGTNRLMANGQSPTAYSYTGHIDEFRVTKSIARYTEDYIIAPYEFLDSPSSIRDTIDSVGVSDGVKAVITIESDTLSVNTENITSDYIVNQLINTTLSLIGTLSNKKESNLYANSDIILGGTGSTSSILNMTISEILSIVDILRVTFSSNIESGIVLIDATSTILESLYSVIESILISEDVTPLSNNNNRIFEGIVTSDNITFGLLKAIEESLLITKTISNRGYLSNNILNSIDISQVILDIYSTFEGLDDSYIVVDTLDSSSILSQIILDFLNVYESVEKDLDYISYLLSPETFSVSTYSNYNFTGSCIYRGIPLFINDTGLHKYGGSNDLGSNIVASIQTAALGFGSSNLKQVPNIYLGLSNSNKIILKVAVDGQADILYNLTKKTEGLQTQKISIGKGLIGRYFQFELITQDSTKFELESIEFLPITLKRKL